ncbi:scavenger receptor cysteine-rich type 1 protein M160-like [Lytechinus pictus]|uniref:scavenger receptor cysteine-rich type 1 protein M160-like n=1 Tax=Lytechinus pictus TaxID=7653 RepID=UPI00240DF764|nr:scavenger receptor cysteine-rich type 1 protein M160-like [Lytechinus pictus]
MKIFALVLLALGPIFGISRGDAVDGLVRLNNRGSTDTNAGILEVYYEGIWRTACAAPNWNSDAATVACRQLGFAASADVANPMDYYSESDNQQAHALLDDGLFCIGTEQFLADCMEERPHIGERCPNGEKFAAVNCAENKKAEDYGDLKLRAVQLLLNLFHGTKK